jgi:arginyl-tRNA synthetase
VLARGIAEMSQGAVVIRVKSVPEPCLIRKSDGGYLYATTDLCAIRRRVQKFGASRVVYCVDARQALHFKQVFEAAQRAGYALNAQGDATLDHAAFGMILGEDGRPFKTRSGENVRLTALIEEAHERALAAALARTPDLEPSEQRAVSHAVAVAAMRYTDLSTERIKDYVFSFDRMLAFEGNTGPYLLYALVRIRSIFRKGAERGIDAAAEARSAIKIEAPAERALALTLLRYPQALRDAGTAAEPHRLCAYAYELAGAFASFFDQCPVLGAPDARARGARLALCRVTERVLADALTTLGIPLIERM